MKKLCFFLKKKKQEREEIKLGKQTKAKKIFEELGENIIWAKEVFETRLQISSQEPGA